MTAVLLTLLTMLLSLTTSSDAMAGHDTVSTADVTSPQHAHGSVTVYCTSTTAVHAQGSTAVVTRELNIA